MLHLHGNAGVVRYLQRCLDTGRLHHAYLIVGPAHVGKTTLALQLAQAANCTAPDAATRPCGACLPCRRIAAGQHADVRTVAVDPTGGEDGRGPRTVVGVDVVHDVLGTAHLRPFEGRSHVFIVQDAGRMSADAANAFLKLLEEPPPDVLILLLATEAGAVLPTVRSRCAMLELMPLPRAEVVRVLGDELGVEPGQAEALARLSRGCIGWAIEAAADTAPVAALQQRLERVVNAAEGGLDVRFAHADDLARRFGRDRQTAREDLYLWLRWLRDVLLIQQGRADDITHLSWGDTLRRHAAALSPAQVSGWAHGVEEALDALDSNANARLALEVLMLEAPAVAPGTAAGR